MTERVRDLGWWVISGDDLMKMLYEVARGENPAIVYAEYYINCTRENLADSDE